MALGDKKYVGFVEDWGKPNSPATLDGNGILNREQWAPQTKWQSNPNLLHNGYFVGGGTNGKFPINQRGQTSYSGEVYGIDRWKATYTGDGTVTITEESVDIARSAYQAYLWQTVENGKLFVGKQITVSALVRNETTAIGDPGLRLRFQNASHETITELSAVTSSDEYVVISTTATVPSNTEEILVGCVSGFNSGVTLKIKAAKLELGDTQTLAHQDENGNWVLNGTPDYEVELAKCKRYYRLYTDANARTEALKEVGLMRTAPSVGTIDMNSTTYYYANAEL